MALEHIAADVGRQLLELLEAMGNAARFPISTRDIRSAKQLLDGFYVQYFDHNSTSLGALCPNLVRYFARNMLDIGASSLPADFI